MAYFERSFQKRLGEDCKGSIDDDSRVIELGPKYIDWPVYLLAFINRGLTKAYIGDLDGAISDATLLINIGADADTAYSNRGNYKVLKGDLDGAIADFNRAIELQSHVDEYYYNRGNAKRANGDMEGAIADCTHAIELHSTQYSYFYRGNARALERNWVEALADYKNWPDPGSETQRKCSFVVFCYVTASSCWQTELRP